MSELIQPAAQWCAALVESLGIGIITATAIYVLCLSLYMRLRSRSVTDIYPAMRQRLGRGILLGLEFLVAADIIHTVAVDLTFSTVGVLACIVLIRTFLSFTLELELTGRWPWQQKP